MKLMVLGGAGYVGTEVSGHLVAAGHDVTVVDPLWFGDHADFEVDMRQQSSFDLTVEDFGGFDTVLHLAAMSNDPMAEYDPARNFVLNQASVSHAAFLARRAGVGRFVYASTCSVYGGAGGRLCDERTDVECGAAYSTSKLFGEQALLSLRSDEFSVISLRKGTISGYGRRMRLDLLLNTMVGQAVSQGVVTVNDPVAWRPLLGIADAVAAYAAAVSAPAGISGVYNVASENLQVLDAARTVVAMVGVATGRPVELTVLDRHDPRSYRADWSKATAELGYVPRDTSRSVVADVVDHRHEFADVDASRFHNIKALQTMPTDRLF